MKSEVVMFCQTNSEQAPAPGQSTFVLRLIAVPGKDGPNAGVFVDGQGQGVLEMQNITDEQSAQFKAGRKYLVTVTEVTA